MLKVSIIIPCYNQGLFLDEAVDSVLKQTFQDFEIIIVDDGSTDEFTRQKLQGYSKPKTTVIITKNKGVSAARNTAIQKSRGKYILPLDADDKIDNIYIEKAVKILDNNENIKVVYCNVELFGSKTGFVNFPVFSMKAFLIKNSIHVSGLFRSKDTKNIIEYDENMKDGLEDWDFWISLLKKGGLVYKIGEPLLKYRRYDNSRQSILDKNKVRNSEIRDYIAKKHQAFSIEILGNPISLALENKIKENQIKLILSSRAYKFSVKLSQFFNFFVKNTKK